MDTAIATDESIGAVIDRLVARDAVKVHRIASEIGMSYGTFKAVRKGKRALKPVEAEALARVFNVPVSTFLPVEGSHGRQADE